MPKSFPTNDLPKDIEEVCCSWVVNYMKYSQECGIPEYNLLGKEFKDLEGGDKRFYEMIVWQVMDALRSKGYELIKKEIL
jgi:hypothetical protein